MNCQDFNNIIAELADYKPMAADLRDVSVSHAALCPDCAANLAAARSVSGLLLQAARAESEEAPARIKQNLLAAFAQSDFVQRPMSNVQRLKEVQSPKFKVQSHGQGTRADVGRWTWDIRQKRWLAAAAAIAAVVLLAAIIPMIRKSAAPLPDPTSDLTAISTGSPAASPVSSPEDKPPAVKENSVKEDQRVTVNTLPTRRRSVKRLPVTTGNSAYETVARNNSEYLPLTYLTAGTAMESGTVVRVELSRSALASLGFNTSGDNSDAAVKAEVILGDDGVARAIRLVE